MERFEIQPVLASKLPEVADFLHLQTSAQKADSSAIQSIQETSLSEEMRLRWLLLENPVATEETPLGFWVRDPSGAIRGITLCFPGAFLAGEQRILGLFSGGFYVEQRARTMGFHLFRKYLSSPAYPLFLSTTCNANSAALWAAMGGWPVPNSEREHIVPLRLDALLPALLRDGATAGAASVVARLAGRCGNPILRFIRKRSEGPTIEPCQDWPKLAELFRRHRSQRWIVTDRSAEFLQWRYGQNSDPHPSGVYLFRDKCGNEGWFSLGSMIRGRGGRIRGAVLLDAILPRGKISFREIFPAIVRLVADHADLISFRPGPGLDYGECNTWIVSHRWPGPCAFAVSRLAFPGSAVAAIDLVPADGDGALPITPVPATERDSVKFRHVSIHNGERVGRSPERTELCHGAGSLP